MDKIKEAIKRQAEEYMRTMEKPTKKKKWTCPRCGKEMDSDFFITWEHVIQGCEKKKLKGYEIFRKIWNETVGGKGFKDHPLADVEFEVKRD